MYRFLRNTHLLLGLFCFLFVLMYGLSALQMAHRRWFDLKPNITESTVQATPGASDARQVARELMDRQDLWGDIAQIRKTPAGAAFRIQNPGAVYEVEYSAETGAAKVKANSPDFLGMLNRLHHVEGLYHDHILSNLWGVFVGVVSVALIVLGGTGIYLWFKLHKERKIGLVLLVVSLSYSLGLLVLMRAA
jgi:hypothetical protein